MRALPTAALLGLVCTPGCMAHYQEYLKDRSVGYTGCHQDEMAISDMYGGATSGWTVTCRGKVFLCSSSGHDETSCHERLP